MTSKRKDTPIFRMVVERGALVPADAYTQERLDTYRINSVVNVRMTQDIDPPLMRKYWSILSLAVKQCRTPWHSSDEASDAIKRAFGVVRRQRSASGAEVEEIGSLTDLEGPAFEDFFEGAMALLYRITGVDPETLWKETPDPANDAPPTEVADTLAQIQGTDSGSSKSADHAGGGGFGLESFPVAADVPGDPSNETASSSASPHDDLVGGNDVPPVVPSATTPPPSLSSANQDDGLEAASIKVTALTVTIEDEPATVKDVDLFGASLRRIDPSTGPNEPGREQPPLMRHKNVVGSIEADERALVNSADPMSTRQLKQEAIRKVLDLALDPDLNDFDRQENLAKARAWWTSEMPGHPNFVKEVFDTALDVINGKMKRPAAQNHLFSLRDG